MVHCKTEGMKNCCEVEKVRRGKQGKIPILSF
jgi:hypothetical protein